MCVCVGVGVHDGSGMFVGRDYRPVTRNLHTSIYSNSVKEHLARAGTAGATSGCNGGAAVGADAIGEQ